MSPSAGRLWLYKSGFCFYFNKDSSSERGYSELVSISLVYLVRLETDEVLSYILWEAIIEVEVVIIALLEYYT